MRDRHRRLRSRYSPLHPFCLDSTTIANHKDKILGKRSRVSRADRHNRYHHNNNNDNNSKVVQTLLTMDSMICHKMLHLDSKPNRLVQDRVLFKHRCNRMSLGLTRLTEPTRSSLMQNHEIICMRYETLKVQQNMNCTSQRTGQF